MHQGDGKDELATVRDRVRAVLSFADVAARDGVEVRRNGRALLAVCPFHNEKSGSFVIGGRAADRAHCFGCGWNGDIFKFWAERHGCDHRQSVTDLASLAGVAPPSEKVQWRRPEAKVERGPAKALDGDDDWSKKPSLPPMRMLRPAEMEQLAQVRGLSVDAVRIAAHDMRLIGVTDWPQFEHDGVWRKRLPCHLSWCLTDATRNTAEFRRLDGKKYLRADGGEIKAWSTRGKNWPIGAAAMGERLCVLLVEGGPDLLAAYHFLHGFGMLKEVAVVAMLGASNRIREEALPFFEGKRVRIMMDADAVREDGSTPGREAAARWTSQLLSYGAVVETFSLAGLTRLDGEPVKDVNDLALCGPDVVGDDDVVEAFCEWKEGFGD